MAMAGKSERRLGISNSNGSLRMFSVYQPDSIKSVWNYPNILAQKFPAEEFTATVKISFKPKFENERFGLVIFGTDYASLSVIKKNDGIYIVQSENINADKNKNEIEDFKHTGKWQ
jgi:hypothetical protein